MVVDGLTLLCAPTPSEDSIKKLSQALKRRYLAQHAFSIQAPGVEEDKEGDGVAATYSERLLDRIIGNVQIVIKNVHFRFEDHLTIPGKCFAFGFTVAQLRAQTTDSEGKSVFVPEGLDQIFKAIDLDDFAVYWNSDAVRWAELPADHRSRLLARIQTETQMKDENLSKKFGYDYILCPLRVRSRLLVRNDLDLDSGDDGAAGKKGKYNLSLCLPNLSVSFDDHQFRDLVQILDYFTAVKLQMEVSEMIASLPKFPAKTEDTHPRDESELLVASSPTPSATWARAWWVHAIKSVIMLKSRRTRLSWPHIKRYCQDRKAYVQYWQQKQDVPWLPALTEQEERYMQLIEQRLDYESIIIFRSLAEHKLKLQSSHAEYLMSQRQKSTANQATSGWLGAVGYYVWGSGEAGEEPLPEELAKALQTIDLSAEDLRSAYDDRKIKKVPENFVKLRLSIVLTDASLKLWEKKVVVSQMSGSKSVETSEILRATLSGGLAFVLRPRSWSAKLGISSMTAEDKCTPNTKFCQLILRPQNGAKGTGTHTSVPAHDPSTDVTGDVNLSEEDLVFVKVESSRSAGAEADVNFRLNVGSMGFVLVPSFLRRIRDFFGQKGSEHLYYAAMSWEQTARADLVVTLTDHNPVDLHVRAQAPTVLVPLDCTVAHSRLLVADIRDISVRSRYQQGKDDQAESEDPKVDSNTVGLPAQYAQLYSTFLLRLDSVRAYMCESVDRWVCQETKFIKPIISVNTYHELVFIYRSSARECCFVQPSLIAASVYEQEIRVMFVSALQNPISRTRLVIFCRFF